MRILLDECVDRRLARSLAGHDVKAVTEMGWAGVKNGALLGLAEGKFDVFLTVDRNLAFQQVLPRFNLAVLVLQAPTNRLADLLPLVPKILALLSTAKPGEVSRIQI